MPPFYMKERKVLQMKMNNRMYDILKDTSLLWMPITITFYGVLSTAWGIPLGEQILATLTGLNAALGAIVKYFKMKFDSEEEEPEAVDDIDDEESEVE